MPVAADTKLELTPSAIRNIRNMQVRVAQIGSEFGLNSDEYRRALESLNQVLIGLIGLGGRIIAEDDLSLLGDSFISYGVIFHRRHIGNNERHPVLGEWSIHS
jgi:hypothetical protein